METKIYISMIGFFMGCSAMVDGASNLMQTVDSDTATIEIDTDSGSDTNSDTNTDGDAEGDTASNSDTAIETNTESESNTDIEIDTETVSNSDLDSDSDGDADSDSNSDSDMDSSSDSDTVGDTDSDSDSDGDGDSDSDIDSNTDSENGDSESDSEIDGCWDAPCFPGVVCTDVIGSGEDFTCGKCPMGMDGNGEDCTDINGCAANPCYTGVQCTDVPAPGTGFNCGSCPAGMQGNGIQCEDIDGCINDPCYSGVACMDVIAPNTGFTCGLCPTGMQGNGTTCVEIDGCVDQDCFPGVACIDVPAPGTGHTCGACPEGYEGDGETCTCQDGVTRAETNGNTWVHVCGGTFGMGAPTFTPFEITIKDLWMLRTEVTKTQFKGCVDAGACVYGSGSYVISKVDWDDAKAYCKWIGGRLPSESEWEYAAKNGGENISLPWCEEGSLCEGATCEYAWIGDYMYEGYVLESCGKDEPKTPCTKLAGNTDQGLCDMVGNVQEWVDGCGLLIDGTTKTCTDDYRRSKGGQAAYSTAKDIYHKVDMYNELKRDDITQLTGFRCAQ